jgi:hypothetical protein
VLRDADIVTFAERAIKANAEDKYSLRSILAALLSALPLPATNEATARPALAAQRRRLKAQNENEDVYMRDHANASGQTTVFLSIPPKSRNKTYNMCFEFPNQSCRFDNVPSTKQGWRTNQMSIITKFGPHLAVLRTAKQINRESLPSLYGRVNIQQPISNEGIMEGIQILVGPCLHMIRQDQLHFDTRLGSSLRTLINRMMISKGVMNYDASSTNSSISVNTVKEMWRQLARFVGDSLAGYLNSEPCAMLRSHGPSGPRTPAVRRADIGIIEIMKLGAAEPFRHCKSYSRPFMTENEYAVIEARTDSIGDKIAIGVDLISGLRVHECKT